MEPRTGRGTLRPCGPAERHGIAESQSESAAQSTECHTQGLLNLMEVELWQFKKWSCNHHFLHLAICFNEHLHSVTPSCRTSQSQLADSWYTYFIYLSSGFSVISASVAPSSFGASSEGCSLASVSPIFCIDVESASEAALIASTLSPSRAVLSSAILA